jgi:23S rRNA pseudouridine1911/1915/1917 synthase
VTHWLLAQYPEVGTEFPEVQPTVTPHRLDTGTSGVLIVSKTQRGYQMWRDRFRRKEVTKTYLAWCWGTPKEEEFFTDMAIAHFPGDSRRMTVASEAHRPPILPAKTRMQVKTRREDLGLFLAEVTCETGVTHQVRVHLASLGFPLVGDALYDPRFSERGISKPHHQLRALRLSWKEGTAQVEAEPFLTIN